MALSGNDSQYRVLYTRQAREDARKLTVTGLTARAQELLAMIEHDPYRAPPRFERLVGNLKGAISRRITIQHRLVYQVVEDQKVVKVLRMWTHYE